MWAHQYDQQPNQIECTVARRPWTTNGPESNLYGLEPNFGCCAANMHQGWPKFASSLWMADAEGGLAAIAYAPCEVRTRIAGVALRVEEETGYPFSGSITVKLHPQKPLRFPLALRIPRWADGSTIRVNGDAMQPQPAGAFAVLNREWRAGDHVELAFPMKVARRQWYNSSVVVERGPIVFSLGIDAEWRKLRTRVMTADWEVRPKSAWNYGLQIKEGNLQASEVRHPTRPGQSIFSLEGAPIKLEIPGRKIVQWKAENRVAGELPQSPASSTEPLEKLVLSPYGAAKLRISVFPTVG
jgi:hypothetical protein